MAVEQLALPALLVAIPLPFWRLAIAPPVRQRRRDQLVLLAALGAYGAGIVAAAVRWPAILPIVAAVAALVTAAIWWRSRPDYGRARGIPPGRIRLHPLDLYEDVDYLSREAGRYGPIFKIGATFPIPTLTPMICVVGHELGLELLRDHERSLEVYPPFPTSRFIPRGFLRNMTRADHERFAPVFRQAFSTCADAAFDRAIAAAARRCLARMAADATAAGGRGIDPAPYLRDFAFDTLAVLHFGFEPDSPERAWLVERSRELNVPGIARWLPQRTRQHRWSATVEGLRARLDPDTAGAARCVAREALRLARSTDPGDESVEATVVGNVLQMQESGSQDLSALLVWVVKLLGDHPDQMERVREERAATDHASGAAGGTRSLAERVIREALRLEQSEYLYRRTTEDIQFRGYLLPRGWRVRICIREGHRAARVFEEPMAFDPDRFLRNVHPPTEYAPFGLYQHHCVAARLAQRVGAVFVEELATAYRLAITGDGPRQHGRYHWQPSPRLRVAVLPWTEASAAPL